ncbi:hypothetical protein KXX32_009907, partial [Aspergillus fumigatus]
VQAPSAICKYRKSRTPRRPNKPGVPNFVNLYETSECCTPLAVSPGLLGSVSVEIERTEVTFYRQIGLGFERVSSEEGLEVLNTRLRECKSKVEQPATKNPYPVASGDLDGKLEAEGGKNKCDQKKFGRFKMMSMGRSSSAWETVTVGPAGQ